MTPKLVTSGDQRRQLQRRSDVVATLLVRETKFIAAILSENLGRCQFPDDFVLGNVRILILVNQDVSVARSHLL